MEKIIVNSATFNFQQEELDLFLKDYNDLLATIYKRHASQNKMLASPLFGRLEGQTKFYEKLLKFCQLQRYLKENSNVILDIASEDWIIARIKMNYPCRLRIMASISSGQI